MGNIIKRTSTTKNNAQSKDFLEIQNTQTEMQVTQKRWDIMFHNYDNPDECANRKQLAGCTVCNALGNQHNNVEK